MRRSRALVTVEALLVLLFATGACSIDHRRLEQRHEDGGESSLGARAGADGGTPEAPGGTSAGGHSSGLVGGCADLNTDGLADCKTTLVKNGSFSSDVSDWLAEPDVELVWQATNALDDTMSGSARLGANMARASAAQCVEVKGRQLVIAYANAFVPVPSLSDTADSGYAELEVSFFETDDCSGDRAGYFETPRSTVVNSWAIVQAGGVSLEVTRSLSLALVGLKPATGAAIEVYFDNVMLQAKEL